MIPYGRQEITQDDIDAVVDVLRSDFLTQGPAVPNFEKAIATRVGARFGVAVNSATSALHIACLSLGLGAGDCLWTTPITFVASANCARYCGADVDFVDIDPATYNIDIESLGHKLEVAKKDGKLPKILVVVHLCGQPCELEAIHALSRQYGFRVIEDASHAIGASYKNAPIGNCQYSDITVFSFHPVKIITTGEGGMAMTNDAQLASRMELLRSHGITRDPLAMTHAPDGPWYYEQIDLGFNYRMTDLQAALGLTQLTRLDTYVARRKAIAARYDHRLSALPVRTPLQIAEAASAWHLYVIRLRLDEITRSREEVVQALRTAGIGVNVHYIPVHTQPYYQALGFRGGDYPQAERYYSEAISLPVYATMSDAQQDTVVDALEAALS
ncbi:UDP-4-amino-4,6-dideoxy-N-acetyl-beta-L-altrosamine transaminase [Caballeronia sp. LZ029]|uniref:UDP-4-amino-4, 6-dideoxy-N-acetyl-beta-L-altrosamine transaminase n=1 Tax=Caballeronia sp. LZ029 TaxID=3038564 RepID=UPI002867166E|nr:UDP-4-amino-4,6-dideoxy-N-acetyl-beta-L-altrosamine transaminase [Caballeronia sp. LZ029]MDR5744240.1 UDP-4-amino-4,6-dideoxy-N-acetyl-beta-L-altrosamine transaminase [Caballeronia sp. LZ029]